jgi:hypothetical protein
MERLPVEYDKTRQQVRRQVHWRAILKRLLAVAMMLEKTIGDTDEIMQQTEPNLLRSKTSNNDLK